MFFKINTKPAELKLKENSYRKISRSSLNSINFNVNFLKLKYNLKNLNESMLF